MCVLLCNTIHLMFLLAVIGMAEIWVAWCWGSFYHEWLHIEEKEVGKKTVVWDKKLRKFFYLPHCNRTNEFVNSDIHWALLFPIFFNGNVKYLAEFQAACYFHIVFVFNFLYSSFLYYYHFFSLFPLNRRFPLSHPPFSHSSKTHDYCDHFFLKM